MDHFNLYLQQLLFQTHFHHFVWLIEFSYNNLFWGHSRWCHHTYHTLIAICTIYIKGHCNKTWWNKLISRDHVCAGRIFIIYSGYSMLIYKFCQKMCDSHMENRHKISVISFREVGKVGITRPKLMEGKTEVEANVIWCTGRTLFALLSGGKFAPVSEAHMCLSLFSEWLGLIWPQPNLFCVPFREN